MIRLDGELDAAASRHLTESVIDARLELVSRLGSKVLGRFAPTAGAISWDTSQRRGKLDVDVIHSTPLLHGEHPLANFGQVIEAWWTWRHIGISVPCGFWLNATATPIGGGEWQLTADPVGPARLDRAQWWRPGGQVTSGLMGQQIATMMLEAEVPWQPDAALTERHLPPTDCQPGNTVLSTVEHVLDQTGAQLRPSRRDRGVIVGQTPEALGNVHHMWTDSTPVVHEIKGSPVVGEAPNRVSVWYEEEADGVQTVDGTSQAIHQGPRRWGGPYGQVPHVVKLDGPASQEAMRGQAAQMLRRWQEETSMVDVVMTADPRIEVGDKARIVSSRDSTDCIARVTSVRLDASTGLGTVSAAALSGTVAGHPTAQFEIS